MTEKKEALPGHETQSDEMNCASCGRFVGAATRCPYCGAKVEKRISLLATRWAAVLLATVGLFLLWLMAVKKEVPVVMLGNIQPTMNFGQIRVIGQSKGDAMQNRTGGGWRFTVDDGTDSMIVWVSKKQAEELNENNQMPKTGDAVDFVGSLSISDEQSSLRLLSVKEFKLTRAPAKEVALADVSSSMKGTSIQVAGKVLGLTPPAADSKRPYTLDLADDSGRQQLTFWQAEYDQIENPAALEGAFIQARVSVDSYKGKLQLILSSGKDLHIIDALPKFQQGKSVAEKAAESYHQEKPSARDFSRGRSSTLKAMPIATVTPEQKGETVRVRGTVKTVRSPKQGSSQPWSLIMEDGDTTLRIVYWDSVNDVLAKRPKPGAVFEAEGIVDVYQDRPQLKILSGYKLLQIEPPPADTAAPEKAVMVADISSKIKGKVRTLKGTLGDRRSLGKGTAYTLTDDSGSIDLVLWDSTVSPKVFKTLKDGITVEATGKVGEYKGILQLVANPGVSVVVIP